MPAQESGVAMFIGFGDPQLLGESGWALMVDHPHPLRQRRT